MSLNIFQLLDLKKGFSLPLWVTGAAKSAVKKLLGFSFTDYELISIPHEKNTVEIKVHSAAILKGESYALAISFAESNLDLDLTQNLEIWTIASFKKSNVTNIESSSRINFIPGYGVGIDQNTSNICISTFAKEILYKNLLEYIPEGFNLNLEIIFPNGKFLAERTSNRSFGIVDGLSIIGTSAETYSSASQEQLNNAKLKLDEVISNNFCGTVIFVIGENGFHLAKSFNSNLPIVKVGNWIGPLLVDAAIKKIKTVILFGYHGKLIKLAGGIFHTHNHLADGRIETLVYLAIQEQVPLEIITLLSQANTVEDGFQIIEKFSIELAKRLWERLCNTIEQRSIQYVRRYFKTNMKIATVIFDRQREIRCLGNNAAEYKSSFTDN